MLNQEQKIRELLSKLHVPLPIRITYQDLIVISENSATRELAKMLDERLIEHDADKGIGTSLPALRMMIDKLVTASKTGLDRASAQLREDVGATYAKLCAEAMVGYKPEAVKELLDEMCQYRQTLKERAAVDGATVTDEWWPVRAVSCKEDTDAE